MQRAATAYLQTQVTTNSQGDIVIMLFDGALKFLTQAREHLENKDMAAKGLAISKALDIINELDSTLNMEKGGAFAANIHGLYVFCTNHLVKANLKKDPKMIDEVMAILSGIRSAWAEVVGLPEVQAAAREAAANIRANSTMPNRSQPGASHAGAPAPGAGARIRATYAMHQEQASPQAAAPAAPAQPKPAQPKPAQPKPAQPAKSAQAARPEEAARPAPAEAGPVPAYSPVMSPAAMQAKADLYRRFSGR